VQVSDGGKVSEQWGNAVDYWGHDIVGQWGKFSEQWGIGDRREHDR